MTTTAFDASLPLLRLLQLVSPSLPIGAFAYSQGIEWAVENGWIGDTRGLSDWLSDQLDDTLALLDIPLLSRLYVACERDDEAQIEYWANSLLAHRETLELRAEERQRGRALTDLLIALDIPCASKRKPLFYRTQLAGFALAANHWRIPLALAALGYAWAWLENLVLVAVKIIPLGQTAGQRLIQELALRLPERVETGLTLEDDAIGSSLPALAIASSRHETQYTRLFRS